MEHLDRLEMEIEITGHQTTGRAELKEADQRSVKMVVVMANQ